MLKRNPANRVSNLAEELTPTISETSAQTKML